MSVGKSVAEKERRRRRRRLGPSSAASDIAGRRVLHGTAIVRGQWVGERSVHCERIGPPALCPLITLRRRRDTLRIYI